MILRPSITKLAPALKERLAGSYWAVICGGMQAQAHTDSNRFNPVKKENEQSG